ncbi:MAG: hypothetical protein FWG31_00655 [Oscillospiraceae bacterium]|nr:hypothetical protein [Oscillospiraceae bacterium]
MKLKTIAVIILTAALLAGLFAGCSGTDDSSPIPSPSKAPDPTPSSAQEPSGNPEPSLEPSDDPVTGLLEEYTGFWTGSVDDISLSFTVEADGSGVYTFEQSGYTESYDFTLEAGTETFSVQIPANNTLGIASIEGTYAYTGGVMTLEVQTTFTTGRVFEYTVPCRKG